MVGMKVVVVNCDKEGNVDIEDLKNKSEKQKKRIYILSGGFKKSVVFTSLYDELLKSKMENDEITYEAYVSEQNLLTDDSDEPIKHPLTEEIFSGKKGSSYFKPSN